MAVLGTVRPWLSWAMSCHLQPRSSWANLRGPMLALMAVSFIFPSLFGGTVGLLLSVVFVVVSAAGLLYQINVVLHRLKTNQHVEGSYMITLGILILYWNILTLLMRLSRR